MAANGNKRSNGETLYSIGEVSKLCNVSKKALRFYDEIGIISPDKVSQGIITGTTQENRFWI